MRVSRTRQVLIAAVILVLSPLLTSNASAQVTHVLQSRFGGVTVSGASGPRFVGPCDVVRTVILSDRDTIWYYEGHENSCGGRNWAIQGSARPSTFSARGHLSSVRVIATVAMSHQVTGQPAGVRHVDETFTATGPVMGPNVRTWTYHDRDLMVMSHSNGIWREAVGTGTVLLDWPTPVIARDNFVDVLFYKH